MVGIEPVNGHWASVGRATASEVARLILNANEPISPSDRFC